ncbi:hypothetical protein CEE45_01665 [Candidatus Heimdallarchaeota archaeon B3_Heim]|nr:MAG: hypothetical protein CEE45_01665 [Candidatus Heimdallarchaeota archaeon B3_Heim]
MSRWNHPKNKKKPEQSISETERIIFEDKVPLSKQKQEISPKQASLSIQQATKLLNYHGSIHLRNLTPNLTNLTRKERK